MHCVLCLVIYFTPLILMLYIDDIAATVFAWGQHFHLQFYWLKMLWSLCHCWWARRNNTLPNLCQWRGCILVCSGACSTITPVAPVALLYFLVCVSLWRRNCIFLDRPKFDSGGERWPFLSDMLIASLSVGQFLLALQMVMRDAHGPALFAAFPSVPTFLYRNYLVQHFRKAYEDAGSLQTSLLDGWDNTIRPQ